MGGHTVSGGDIPTRDGWRGPGDFLATFPPPRIQKNPRPAPAQNSKSFSIPNEKEKWFPLLKCNTQILNNSKSEKIPAPAWKNSPPRLKILSLSQLQMKRKNDFRP